MTHYESTDSLCDVVHFVCALLAAGNSRGDFVSNCVVVVAAVAIGGDYGGSGIWADKGTPAFAGARIEHWARQRVNSW
jgi:hypothetical protein